MTHILSIRPGIRREVPIPIAIATKRYIHHQPKWVSQVKSSLAGEGGYERVVSVVILSFRFLREYRLDSSVRLSKSHVAMGYMIRGS